MRKSTTVDLLSTIGETFTFEDAKRLCNLTYGSLKNLLYRLEVAGWIERIERGKYMLIPLGAEKGKYTLNEFVIGSMLVAPYCISYWSALHYYGLTEQIPATVFIQTTSRKKKQKLEVFGVKYQIIRLKPEKFFGMKTEWFGNEPIQITDKEKTIIDCLDKPHYCGGLIEVIKGISEGDFDKNLIVKYANEIKNTGVIRRLGFLSDYYNIHLDLPHIDKNIRNYLPLDSTMPKEGKKDSKWRLIVNLREYDLESIK